MCKSLSALNLLQSGKEGDAESLGLLTAECKPQFNSSRNVHADAVLCRPLVCAVRHVRQQFFALFVRGKGDNICYDRRIWSCHAQQFFARGGWGSPWGFGQVSVAFSQCRSVIAQISEPPSMDVIFTSSEVATRRHASTVQGNPLRHLHAYVDAWELGGPAGCLLWLMWLARCLAGG